MTDTDLESASLPDSSLSDDLPPVQPPSAGFIVQLFVFPALIVMGVVAIWWMFGLIAVGEQDWHKLLQDLQSPNLHIRNRAMYGLAQVLDQDIRLGKGGNNLRANRDIAKGLSDQLIAELKTNSSSKEGLAIQEYLTRAMGMMATLDVTASALRMALEPQRDLEIRKSAVVSLSLVAGQAQEVGQPLSNPECVDALVQLSGDPQPVMRQTAAFALGLFDSEEATHQLEVFLENPDKMTAVNAAIGLARHGSTKGFIVIRNSLLKPEGGAAPLNSDAADDRFRIVKNVLKAANDLATKFDDAQRGELIPIVEKLSIDDPEIRIRVDASAALQSLKRAEHNIGS